MIREFLKELFIQTILTFLPHTITLCGFAIPTVAILVVVIILVFAFRKFFPLQWEKIANFFKI